MAVEYDPVTGLPKTKKGGPPPVATGQVLQDQMAASIAANPNATFGPSSSVNYAGSQPQATQQGMPDYKALIAAALGPLTAQYGADDASDLATRNQQFIRALGQFGEQFDLAGATQAFGADFVNSAGLESVLPQANVLAQQTTDSGMSFSARATKAHKDAVRQIKNALAARGLLRSGETGHLLQEQQTEFDTGQYDARQKMQDYLGAVNQGYVQAVRARQAALAGATREEAERQARLNPGTATTPPAEAPPAAVAPRSTQGGAAGETPWQRALRLRSEELNRLYGVGGGASGGPLKTM